MSAAEKLSKFLSSLSNKEKNKIIDVIHGDGDEKDKNIIIHGLNLKKTTFFIDIMNCLNYRHEILKNSIEYIKLSYAVNSDGVPFFENDVDIFCEEVFPIKQKAEIYLNHSEMRLTGINVEKKSDNLIYSFLNNAEADLKKVNQISLLKPEEKIKLNHEVYVLKEYYLEPASETYKKNMVLYDTKNDVYFKISMTVYANGEKDDSFSEYYLPLEKTLKPEIVYPHQIEKNVYVTEQEIDLNFRKFVK